MNKKSLRQISTNEISLNLPDLKNIEEAKAAAISKWLMEWIDKDLECGKISAGNLLPGKPDLAFLLGVSIGTIQNALRFVEDAGYVQSKQCIGTIINGKNPNPEIRKLTSKREIASEKIKQFIVSRNFKAGENLPSSRTIAKEIESSPNTTRLALENLCAEGILEHNFKKSNDAGWRVKSIDFSISDKISGTDTLVKKVEEDLKKYITENLKIGDKIPPHGELAQILHVSIKTIHDALKVICEEGILLPRRGRY